MNDLSHPPLHQQKLGAYEFFFEPVTSRLSCFEFVAHTVCKHVCSDDTYETYVFTISDSDSVIFIQTVLELECAHHLMSDQWVNFLAFLGHKNNFYINNSSWQWTKDYPLHFSRHNTLERFDIYHYDLQGQKTKIQFKNDAVISEIKALDQCFGVDYKAHYESIIEREINTLRAQQEANNLGKIIGNPGDTHIKPSFKI